MEGGYLVGYGDSSRKTWILDTRGLSGVPGWQTGGQRDNNGFGQDVPSQSWGYASDGIYMPQEHRAPRPCIVLSASLLYRSRRQLHEFNGTGSPRDWRCDVGRLG
jgi:hypothetical protein